MRHRTRHRLERLRGHTGLTWLGLASATLTGVVVCGVVLVMSAAPAAQPPHPATPERSPGSAEARAQSAPALMGGTDRADAREDGSR